MEIELVCTYTCQRCPISYFGFPPFNNLINIILLTHQINQKTRRQFESRLRTAHSRSGYVRWGGGGGGGRGGGGGP